MVKTILYAHPFICYHQISKGASHIKWYILYSYIYYLYHRGPTSAPWAFLPITPSRILTPCHSLRGNFLSTLATLSPSQWVRSLSSHTHGLRKLNTKPTSFKLAIDKFGAEYLKNAQHLIKEDKLKNSFINSNILHQKNHNILQASGNCHNMERKYN